MPKKMAPSKAHKQQKNASQERVVPEAQTLLLAKALDISRPVSTMKGNKSPVMRWMYSTVAPSVFSWRRLCFKRAVRCFKNKSHACEARPSRKRRTTARHAARGPPCSDFSGLTRNSFISTSLSCRMRPSIFNLKTKRKSLP